MKRFDVAQAPLREKMGRFDVVGVGSGGSAGRTSRLGRGVEGRDLSLGPHPTFMTCGTPLRCVSDPYEGPEDANKIASGGLKGPCSR